MQWKGVTYLAASQLVGATFSTAFCNQTPSIQKVLRPVVTALQEKRKYSETTPVNMPRGVKKENLPSKVCVTCGRPFTWRKKWERVWDEVTTCSKSCNHKRRVASRQHGKTSNDGLSTDGLKNDPKFSQSISDQDGLSNDFPSILELGLESNERMQAVSFRLSKEGVAESRNDVSANLCNDPVVLAKEQRKALKKAKKAERRAQREGRGDPSVGQKQCDMCGKPVNLLIRCMYEEGQVDWSMVCGKCWNVASGGVVDGDANHPHYRYGGLWKNRRAQT
jgi:hypothetical protein